MKCALVGRVLGHSHSPRIHHALAGYEYELRPVEPQDLDALLTDPLYAGFNVTIPYKQAAMSACARLDPLVERIGALNTIVRQPDGSNWGYNTDYPGFLAMADRSGICFENKKVLVLGTGGTSHTVCCALKDRHAAQIITVSRSGPVDYDTVRREHLDAQIIVNTTPSGMYPDMEGQALSLDGFDQLQGVLDVVYNPLRTNLILDAQQRGIPCSGGLYMLAAQARYAAQLFTGREISREQTDQVYARLARDLTDLVLIGMPGSGKSTLGRMAAQALGREFIDTDEVIRDQAGCSIPEIFEREGEAGFRERERRAVSEVCRGGRVIAAGGGAPLFAQNRSAFRRTGCVVYLDRDVSCLDRTGRPLSLQADSLETMKQARMPAYRACMDYEISNRGEPEQVLTAILEGFNAYFDH